jgi:hypothetical protein
MPGEKNFRIVATDGDKIKEIMWIRHTGYELYMGVVYQKEIDQHFSYHEDGTFHCKIIKKDGTEIKVMSKKLPPLNNFKNEKQLFFSTGSAEFILENSIRDYDFREYDEIIFVDMRTCRDKQFNISVHLVEPNRLDLLKPEFFGNKTHIHVLTSVVPWIVIITI